MRNFPLLLRAGIVSLAFLLTVYMLAKLRILQFLLFLIVKALSGVALLLELVLLPLKAKYPGVYIKSGNWLLGNCLASVVRFSERVKDLTKRPKIQWFVAVWALLLVLVGFVSPAQSLYAWIEKPALDKAWHYYPQFDFSTHTASMEEPQDENASLTRLTLTEQGRNGSNIRSGPGMEYDSVAIVAEDDVIYWLGDRFERWIHVQLDNGEDGWIFDELIVGMS